MQSEDPTISRYLNGDYAEKNPDWDSGDSGWKAANVARILSDHGLAPDDVVEIGCGSGAVLVALRQLMPAASYSGYDIAPAAESFWSAPLAQGIRFELADFHATTRRKADAILLLDVIEHVGNPWDFLTSLRDRADHLVLHFPLDLSVSSVLREKPLLHVRDKVGHLHFYTKGLVLALMEECGYDVIEARFTGASLNSPNRGLRTKILGLIRRAIFMLDRDFGARLLGGETLMVLARPRGGT
jgi:SAM-dependent methyltransferase